MSKYLQEGDSASGSNFAGNTTQASFLVEAAPECEHFIGVRLSPEKPSLFGETLETLTEILKEAGHPAFRARQVMDWLYKKRVQALDEMSNLPISLRQWLDANYCIYPVRPVLDKRSNDVTQKLLMELEDRSSVSYTHLTLPTNREV